MFLNVAVMLMALAASWGAALALENRVLEHHASGHRAKMESMLKERAIVQA
jgi:hypothetical protein